MSRGFRVLVRAWPPGRRRGELLDTFAEAGRARPGLTEAGNLVRHGLRARLGRPRSVGVVVLAFMVALVTGYGGAAAATRVAWEFVPGYPEGAALSEITETVYPGLDSERDIVRPDGLFYDPMGDGFLGSHSEDFQFATVDFGPAAGHISGGYPGWTEQAHARLAAAGWDVSAIEPTGNTYIATGELDPSGTVFTATRDGLHLTINTDTITVGIPPGSFWTVTALDRLQPGWITVVGWAGLLLFGIAGWFVAGWVSRRTEGATGVARLLSREPAVLGLVLLFPQALLGAIGIGFFAVTASGSQPPVQPFWSLSVTWFFGCTFLGVALLLLPVLVAVFAKRPVTVPEARA